MTSGTAALKRKTGAINHQPITQIMCVPQIIPTILDLCTIKINPSEGDQSTRAQAGKSAKQAAKHTGQTQRGKQRGQIGERDADVVAVQESQVQQLSAVQDGQTIVLALVEELLAVVDAAGRADGAGRVAEEVDAVAVERGNVAQLGAVANADAGVDTLVGEDLAVVERWRRGCTGRSGGGGYFLACGRGSSGPRASGSDLVGRSRSGNDKRGEGPRLEKHDCTER